LPLYFASIFAKGVKETAYQTVYVCYVTHNLECEFSWALFGGDLCNLFRLWVMPMAHYVGSGYEAHRE
jgi:hypothetical protein